MRSAILAALAFAVALPAAAASIAERPGWRVIDTEIPYGDLLMRIHNAIAANDMIAVTQAGPTAAAKRRGIDIPGNRVIGVFRNDFAVRALEASVAAMIEAPIRFYVTEEADGTGTLSWKTPSHVFAPYMEEGGAELQAVAEELDAIFEKIGTDAVAE